MYNEEGQIKTYVMIGTLVMLLVIFSGITYAFFSASNNKGSTSIVSIESGKMLITYNDGTDNVVPVVDIQPSNNILVNKTFSLTGKNTATGMKDGEGLTMPYKVGLKYTSTFSDGQMHYYIKEVNRPSSSKVTVEYTGTTNQTVQGNSSYTGYSHGTLKKGNKYTEMVTGIFPANTSNQTITFNLILQFPDTGENQDSEKGATINGKVVVNYEPPKAKSFAEDTWETIADNTSSNVYNVGDTKTVLIGNQPYTVRVANKSTPAKCNDSDFSQTACGFVVEFVDIVEERVMNSTQTNAGGWVKSEMRTYANGAFFNNLPEDLRNVIKDTKVVSGHGSEDTSNFTSTDKIYLLSGHEVYETVNNILLSSRDTAYNQTRQLDYYKSKGVTTDNYSGAIKKNNGRNFQWWLRVADSSYSAVFLNVSSRGGVSGFYATDGYGFTPAFRIG